MTCRLFVDEVGNGDLKGAATDPNIRYLSLTGIITKRRAHDATIQPRLDRLKDRFFNSCDGAVILHRRDIMRRKGPFEILRNDKIRSAFDDELLALVYRLPYIAITVTIDKKEHLEKYMRWHFDPYHYCLRCLVERYVNWLKRHNLKGDVAIEPRFKLVDKKLKSSFQKIYEDGTNHMPSTIVQKCLLSKDIKFEPKKNNCAGIQLCDLIAHPSFRAMKMAREGLPPPSDFGGRVADILVRRRYARHPETHAIDGWGQKWLP
jgi:hypothetical protein